MSVATPPAFEKVRSTRAHEQIVEQLQQLILSGQLAPGSRLPSERAMMTTFNVSRPTVREALRVAESMGLIAVRHGDPGGPTVLGNPSAGLTRLFDGLLRHEVMSRVELMQLRIILDSSAAALACSQPRSHLAPAAEILKQMHATEDLESFAKLDTCFHHAIISAGGNQLFTMVYEALEEPIRRLIADSLADGYARKRTEALRQHSHILEFIQQKHPREAARAVREHFRQTCFPKLDDSERRSLENFFNAMG